MGKNVLLQKFCILFIFGGEKKEGRNGKKEVLLPFDIFEFCYCAVFMNVGKNKLNYKKKV
jgi:hypothetical protein